MMHPFSKLKSARGFSFAIIICATTSMLSHPSTNIDAPKAAVLTPISSKWQKSGKYYQSCSLQNLAI